MGNIEKVEEFEDHLKIHFHFFNGPAIADRYEVRVVLFSLIPKLTLAPPFPDRRDDDAKFWSESIFISKLGKTIKYHFVEWQETNHSLMQGLSGGPYLTDNSN